MTKKIEGKKAVITGASSGIGEAIAYLLAEEGAELCLVARRGDLLSQVSEKCGRSGVQCHAIVTDLTNETQVQEMTEQCIAALKTVHILINNAGYGRYAPFLETAIEEWDRMWNVNVRGTVLVTRGLLPHMIEGGGGHIVNMSSTHGVYASANASAYCATKFAINGFSEALSKELWKNGIKVSVICPGGVLTPFLGIPPEKKNQEFLKADEVARIVLDTLTAPDNALVARVILMPKNIPFVRHEISS